MRLIEPPADPPGDAAPERTVRCPACGGPSAYAAHNPYRPFCSAHCKGLDLGAWAAERYAIAAEPDVPAEPNDFQPPFNQIGQ